MPAVLLALLPTLLSSLVPVAADGVRGIFNLFTRGAGARPANVEEAVKLMDAETNRLKVLAELDRPSGAISPWVANLRASFRYLGAGVVLIPLVPMALWTLYDPSPARAALLETYSTQMAGPVWGFIFGDRLRMHMRNGG